MTPTEQLRERLLAHLGGRFDGHKRTLRQVGAECGVSFNTISRFARGRQITSDVFDRLHALLHDSAGATERGDSE